MLTSVCPTQRDVDNSAAACRATTEENFPGPCVIHVSWSEVAPVLDKRGYENIDAGLL